MFAFFAASLEARVSSRVQALNPPTTSAATPGPSICEVCIAYVTRYTAIANANRLTLQSPNEKDTEKALAVATEGCAHASIPPALRGPCSNEIHHVINKKNSANLSFFADAHLYGCLNSKDKTAVQPCPAHVVCSFVFPGATKSVCPPLKDYPSRPFALAGAATPASASAAAPGPKGPGK